MSTQVLTFEIEQLAQDLTLLPTAEGILALVRHGGRPAGLIRVAGRGTIPATRIAAALAEIPALPPPFSGPSEPLSIVICTHERPDDLARCLTGLRPLFEAGHEVIVVDNAPRTDRTAAVAACFPYRYIVEPRQGLNHARNCGLHAASHALVAYSDDDAVADPGWAAAIARPFADPSVDCVTGLVLPLELETPAQEQFEIYCRGRRVFTPQRISAATTPPAAAGIAGMGANMAVRREAALALGGFDPRLDAGTVTCSGGDTDMFARVLDSGATIVYTPDALVWHRHRRSMAELNDCLFGYGVGLYAFLSKRLFEQHDLRALEIALRWWGGPIVKAAWAHLQGRPALPADLLLREAAGAFFGPLRLRRASRREQRYQAGNRQPMGTHTPS